MEGPYISPEDGARGAHRREDISPPSVDDFRRRQAAAGGRIRLVTVAPEVPGVLPVIEQLVKDGVRVAIGHTAASPQQVRDAVSAGATMSTHLGNGCAQMLPRHPNFLWEQLAADELMAGADRGWAPPSGGDRQVDGARQDARTHDSGDRRHDGGRTSARRLHAGERSRAPRRERTRGGAGSAQPRRICPVAGSRHRQHGAVHRAAARRCDRHGHDDAGHATWASRREARCTRRGIPRPGSSTSIE